MRGPVSITQRGFLIDWVLGYASEHNLTSDCTFTAVNIIDRSGICVWYIFTTFLSVNDFLIVIVNDFMIHIIIIRVLSTIVVPVANLQLLGSVALVLADKVHGNVPGFRCCTAV
jgi:hypothetical protein